MKQSNILNTVHKTVKGLYKIGVTNNITMKEVEALCLPKVPCFKPYQIKQIREREEVSQSIFALFLNVSSSTVKKWETGEKHPNGAAAKLLALIDYYGLVLLTHYAEAK